MYGLFMVYEPSEFCPETQKSLILTHEDKEHLITMAEESMLGIEMSPPITWDERRLVSSEVQHLGAAEPYHFEIGIAIEQPHLRLVK